MKLWVVVKGHGGGQLSPPVAAFLTQKEAMDFAEVIQAECPVQVYETRLMRYTPERNEPQWRMERDEVLVTRPGWVEAMNKKPGGIPPCENVVFGGEKPREKG